ncbi:MAG TPA: EamA family transporter [Xanthomonadaceae bacterium]|nr:EamA family transporter [Xanthomonadaceae bacterium]
MSIAVLPVWMLTVALDTVGQVAFKAATSDACAGEGLARWRYMACRPVLWLGIACYVFQLLAWTVFLSLMPLGRGVLLGSINIVAILLAGRVIFRERLTPMRMAGVALICLGVVVVGLSP